VILTPNITGLSKPRFSKSISTPIPTNGAAKNPRANKREGNSNARTRICFCTMSVPTKTPNNIKLIAETHLIKMSNSLPRTLDSLRSNKDRQTMKANVHIHKSFARFMMFATSHSFGGLFKTMDTFNDLVHSQNSPLFLLGSAIAIPQNHRLTIFKGFLLVFLVLSILLGECYRCRRQSVLP
jgi:hypothetical protein